MKRINRQNVRVGALVTIISAFLVVACSDSPGSRDTTTGEINNAGNVVAAEKPAMRVSNQTRGVVKSAQTAGAYTYIEIEAGDNNLWLATTATVVQPGQTINWKASATMQNFTSKALGRTFDRILFVEKIYRSGAMQAGGQQGRILESMTAGGYSFLRVDQNGKSIWLAAPQIAVETGQQVSWTGGSPMRNFTSRSLDRTFSEILFVASVNPS